MSGNNERKGEDQSFSNKKRRDEPGTTDKKQYLSSLLPEVISLAHTLANISLEAQQRVLPINPKLLQLACSSISFFEKTCKEASESGKINEFVEKTLDTASNTKVNHAGIVMHLVNKDYESLGREVAPLFMHKLSPLVQSIVELDEKIKTNDPRRVKYDDFFFAIHATQVVWKALLSLQTRMSPKELDELDTNNHAIFVGALLPDFLE